MPAVRIPVVVLVAQAHGRQPSPILYLPGGPGLPAGLDEPGIERWLNWSANARWPHDLVLFDPRGTGLSQPRLACPEIGRADRRSLTRPLTAAEDLRQLQASAAACRLRLDATGFSANEYSTARLVQDASELMSLLGGSDWNLYGISYGSRLALQLARQQPDRIRSLLLDSVYPPEVNGLMSRPQQFARARSNLLRHCAETDECRLANPSLAQDLDDLFRRLRRSPVRLEVVQWPHEPVPLLLNDYRLLWMLFLESYQARYRPRLVPAVTAAAHGDFSGWQAIAVDYLRDWLDPDFSHPVYFSVSCAEDMPGTSDVSYRREVARYPAIASYLSEDWRLSPCHHWPVAAVPSTYRHPVHAAVPVLLLSGSHDAATLPEWAGQQFVHLSRLRHIIFQDSSHGPSWVNPCAMAVAWEFLRDPETVTLPSCLSHWERLHMRSQFPAREAGDDG